MKDLKNLMKFRRTLSRYRSYDSNTESIDFKYHFDPELETIKQKYSLMNIIKDKDYESQIIELMLWVSHSIIHDGYCGPVDELNALFLLDRCIKQKIGINCFMVALVMQEVYMSCGFPARIVQTKSIEAGDLNTHWVNIVYSEPRRKWLMMDATFCTYCYNDSGILSIEEIRNSIINNKSFHVYEGAAQAGLSQNQYYFLSAQNYFIFDTLLLNGYKSMEKEGQQIIRLVPAGFDYKDYNQKNMTLLNNLFLSKYGSVIKTSGVVNLKENVEEALEAYKVAIGKTKDDSVQNVQAELRRLRLHNSCTQHTSDSAAFWKTPE